MANASDIEVFDFPPGYPLSDRYLVKDKLGAGWEGEVYTVEERATGIVRAAKFFYPRRNRRNKAANFYAKKLHKLRHCPILIQYLTQDWFFFQGLPVTFLISEFVDGEPLPIFLKRQPGGRLRPFQALHLLYSLIKGIEEIHLHKDYHGDLHADNVMVERYGLSFHLKIFDFFHHGSATTHHMQTDVCDVIRIFYDSLGGKRFYNSQPPEVKYICAGLKQSLILQRFRTAGKLREFLENMEWS